MDDILAKKNRHLFLEEKDNVGNSFIANVNNIVDDLDNIDTVANDLGRIDTVADNIDNVNTVAENIDDINTTVENLDKIDQFNDNLVGLLESLLEQLGEDGNAWLVRLTELGESILATTSAFNYAVTTTLEQDIASGATLTLPEAMKYRVGTHMLMVSWNGTVCYVDDQYNEVGNFGQWSTTITMNVSLKTGDKIQFRVVALADSTAFIGQIDSVIGNTSVVATGSTENRTLANRFADVVNVKDFGAVGNGETDDTEAIKDAIIAASSGRVKTVWFPSGTYLVSSNEVAEGEGACFILGASASGLSFIGSNAVIKPTTNKINIFCINGATNISFDNIDFDNSLNGLLQNQPKVNMSPGTGVAGNGNAACLAIGVYKGSGLRVENCIFRYFTIGIFYICDYENNQTLGGHLRSFNNSFYNCIQGHLANTPESYEIISCRAWDTKNSVNDDDSVDPGHLLYVTDRLGGVPKIGIISDISDTNGQCNAIQVRKGVSVILNNINVVNSAHGIELTGCQTCTLTNSVFKLATVVGGHTNASAIKIVNCCGVRVNNILIDIRDIDAWGFRIETDVNALISNANKNLSVSNITILSDYTNNRGKAPVNITSQSNFTVDGIHWIVYGTTANTRAFINVVDSSYGFIKNISTVFEDDSATTNLLSLDSDSDHITAFVNESDAHPFGTADYRDYGSNNIINNISISGDGTASAPSLSFFRDSDTGMYRVSNGLIGFSVNGSAVFGIGGTDIRPLQTETIKLGYPNSLWSEVYAATATINTSDVRKKTNLETPSDALMRAWGKVNFKVFQFIDSVEKKGISKARMHIGIIAQQVSDAFASESLDASRYGLFCYDSWEDKFEDVKVVDAPAVYDHETGEEIIPEQVHIEHRQIQWAGDSYGIRYEEALALECAYQRWLGKQRDAKIEALMQRISALENNQ